MRKPFSVKWFSAISISVLLVTAVLIAGCDANGPSTVGAQSVENPRPFYTGTLEIVQAPTVEKPNRDLLIDLNVTLEPDSTGWPTTYYGADPGEDRVPINAVRFHWLPNVRYFDATDSTYYAVEEVDNDQRLGEAMDLPPEEEADTAAAATRSFQVRFPASEFERLPHPISGLLEGLPPLAGMRIGGSAEAINLVLTFHSPLLL